MDRFFKVDSKVDEIYVTRVGSGFRANTEFNKYSSSPKSLQQNGFKGVGLGRINPLLNKYL